MDLSERLASSAVARNSHHEDRRASSPARRIPPEIPGLDESLQEWMMDAFEQLRKDHLRIQTLLGSFGRACQTALDRAQGLFATLLHELQIHGQLEEKLLYPVLGSVVPERVAQARRRHRKIDQMLSRMQDQRVGSSQFSCWAWDLAASVELHLETQDRELVPAAREGLSPALLEELGRELIDLRRVLLRVALRDV